MKAAYVKAPFEIVIKEAPRRALTDTEVRLDIHACSVCGHDLILMRYAATELQQFGHEVVGVITEVGRLVENVKVGDRVVLESGTYDRFSDAARNGRVDLNNRGPNFWIKGEDNMGFAEDMIAPCECCVKVPDALTDDQVVLIEPMGVALDLVKTADIHLTQDVLVMGLGPIGLMAARMAKLSGARHVYATELPASKAKIELAEKWGIEVIEPDKVEQYPFPAGGVDHVLVTAHPSVIPTALKICNRGGIVSFLAIAYGEDRMVSIDTCYVHEMKLQLRASNASPALYFPECLRLIESGAVDTAALISHRCTLDGLQQAVQAFAKDREHGVKCVMYNK